MGLAMERPPTRLGLPWGGMKSLQQEPSEGWDARGTHLGVTVAHPGDSLFL